MAMPKRAPYKPNFDRIVSRVVEAGLVSYAELLVSFVYSSLLNLNFLSV